MTSEIRTTECQVCRGRAGGIPGNENILELATGNLVLCDECYAALLDWVRAGGRP
jgi:hypothetical protein